MNYISKQLLMFCLTVAELNKCTRKGPSDKTLFFYEVIYKIHTPSTAISISIKRELKISVQL
jgi:hypothetical protein